MQRITHVFCRYKACSVARMLMINIRFFTITFFKRGRRLLHFTSQHKSSSILASRLLHHSPQSAALIWSVNPRVVTPLPGRSIVMFITVIMHIYPKTSYLSAIIAMRGVRSQRVLKNISSFPVNWPANLKFEFDEPDLPCRKYERLLWSWRDLALILSRFNALQPVLA
jgi:hypothetical protein